MQTGAVQFQYELLQGVARSFALTIPQLPVALRDVVANAYLLCRIADTIEDEAAIRPPIKQHLAQTYIGLIEGSGDIESFVQRFEGLLSEQRLPAERRLIQQTAQVVAVTRSFSMQQQAILARCVRVMTEGMVYYQAHASRSGLPSLQIFNNYCYHVAGVVGEMLTDLFGNYSAAFDRRQLLPLALSFGQGLQMTNILKDIHEDYRRGVCWLPRDVFAAHGFNLDQLADGHRSAAFAGGLQQLIAIAGGHLLHAREFVLQIPRAETGVRKFCLWAIGMAWLTLSRIASNPGFVAASDVKIHRADVGSVIAASAFACRSNLLFKFVFKRWRGSLPVVTSVATDSQHDAIAIWFAGAGENA